MIESYQPEVSKDTVWVSKTKNFKVPDKVMDETLNLFYQETTKEASKAIESIETTKRFRSVCFSLTEEEVNELKEDMEGFLDKIKNKYGANKGGIRKYFKVNLQSYSVTKDIVNQ